MLSLTVLIQFPSPYIPFSWSLQMRSLFLCLFIFIFFLRKGKKDQHFCPLNFFYLLLPLSKGLFFYPLKYWFFPNIQFLPLFSQFLFSPFLNFLLPYHPSPLDTPVSVALLSFYDPSPHFQLLVSHSCQVSYQLLKSNIFQLNQFSKAKSFSLSSSYWGSFFRFPGSRLWYRLQFLCCHSSFTSKVLEILFPADVCPMCWFYLSPWQPL